MKYRIMALFSLAATLASAPVAHADSYTYNLQSSDGSVQLSNLTFTTAGSCNGAGQICDITGISGTLTDTNFLPSPETITSFAPGGGGSLYLTGDFLFVYDNQINPDGTAAGFDGSFLDGTGGVVFYVDSPTPLEVGLSGGATNSFFLNESPDGINYNYPLNPETIGMTESTVPEPSPLLLMGSGLLMLALAGRKLAPKLQAVKASS
jgi:hypothetical protein